MSNISKEQFLKALGQVHDPVTGKNLVDQGRIRQLELVGDTWHLDVEVLSPTLHIKKKLEQDIKEALQAAGLGETPVSFQFSVNQTARNEARKILPEVRHVIAVASGKGGVGKSTVTVNLAAALSSMGAKVGILDADIYGPSIPLMLDTKYVRPTLKKYEDGRSLIQPVEHYGIKMLSIGFFAGDDQAVAWRGPMASKALTQMFTDADWGALDYLLVDLPPGTGDIHLSLVQTAPLNGAIVVSTPQEVALADARKGIAMFRMPNINVPVLGLVENMAWFTPEELPDNKYYIFGKGGAAKLAEELKVPLLGQLPLIQGLRESGDKGFPAALDSSNPAQSHFMEMAANVAEFVHLIGKKDA